MHQSCAAAPADVGSGAAAFEFGLAGGVEQGFGGDAGGVENPTDIGVKGRCLDGEIERVLFPAGRVDGFGLSVGAFGRVQRDLPQGSQLRFQRVINRRRVWSVLPQSLHKLRRYAEGLAHGLVGAAQRPAPTPAR